VCCRAAARKTSCALPPGRGRAARARSRWWCWWWCQCQAHRSHTRRSPWRTNQSRSHTKRDGSMYTPGLIGRERGRTRSSSPPLFAQTRARTTPCNKDTQPPTPGGAHAQQEVWCGYRRSRSAPCSEAPSLLAARHGPQQRRRRPAEA
jgi:hypothetical protein